MSLDIRILPPKALSREIRNSMFSLLAGYFDGIQRPVFDKDLMDKDGVLLAGEPSGNLVAFTTYQWLEFEFEGQSCKAVFSGDTVKHTAYFGKEIFAAKWLEHILESTALSCTRLYWFLICSGYHTYKYLPTFCRRYYPSVESNYPQDKALLDHLALLKFGDDYNPEKGVVRFSHSQERLKPMIAPISEELKRRNAHVRFFAERNPDHAQGTELCCLTELVEDNFRPSVRRLLKPKAFLP